MENLLHLKAPGDWINDPNGFIFYRGEYHLFYQYFPCASEWGTMHWGHAVSRDLVHWTHLGIALYPTKVYDQNGMFSGSAVERDGRLWLYYTAVQYQGHDPENIHHADENGCLQSQALLISEDGRSFDNIHNKQQIIPPFTNEEVADPHDCRDPKVWQENGKWYMTLGSTNRAHHTGVLLIMESTDGISWDVNCRTEDAGFGHTLECPDLFTVDGERVLIASPMGNMSHAGYLENQAVMQRASFDPNQRCFALGGAKKCLDYGMELYAPQSNLDRDGRRTVISWLRMPKAASPETNPAANGRTWNGMMSLPRVISIRNGEIITSVHPNVRAFFDAHGTCIKEDEAYRECVYEGQHQIKTTLSEGQTRSIGALSLSLIDGQVQLDRSRAISSDLNVHRISSTPVVGDHCEIEVYLEENSVEVYVNDGQYVITNWIEQ